MKRLTAYIEDEINKVEDKNAIDKIWGEKKVRTFYKPTKAPKEREKSFFDVIDTYLSSHKLSEQRLKNFKVLTRCLHRFELFKKKDGSRVFSLTLANLSPELLRQIEDFLTDEKAIFLRYPEIYEQFPYSAKIAVKTPKRKRPPILDDEGNEVPKGMPKPRGQNTVADLLTRFRLFSGLSTTAIPPTIRSNTSQSARSCTGHLSTSAMKNGTNCSKPICPTTKKWKHSGIFSFFNALSVAASATFTK